MLHQCFKNKQTIVPVGTVKFVETVDHHQNADMLVVPLRRNVDFTGTH